MAEPRPPVDFRATSQERIDMVPLPFGAGLRFLEGPLPPARRPSAGAGPGR